MKLLIKKTSSNSIFCYIIIALDRHETRKTGTERPLENYHQIDDENDGAKTPKPQNPVRK